ncbi:tyrosine-type recombinase/integrase [Nonomuraea angiospora]|uniref:tyrosine-type recombinase/integrase n=1 Tax=Nonomuraea angiospora TaxID=46172 RepID=UPI00178B60B3|nr:tyrosine-type recombinase/integrase [Nonomuraea angiospora]
MSTKISRHLERLRAWLAAGLGHPRVSAVTAREITAWRDHLAAARWRRKDGSAAATHRHARPPRDRAVVHTMLGTGLRRAEIAGPDLAQLEPRDPAQLRRVKEAKLSGVRGKGRTSRSVFLGLDARTALADYLEHGRGLDVSDESAALFLAASSIAARRPDGQLSPRSINTIVAIHDLQVTGADRQLGRLRPHDLRHTFAYLLSQASGHNRAELERRLGHANEPAPAWRNR